MTRFQVETMRQEVRQRRKGHWRWRLKNREHKVLESSSSGEESTEKNYRRWQRGRHSRAGLNSSNEENGQWIVEVAIRKGRD